MKRPIPDPESPQPRLRLIVFARRPEVGRVKTRLIPVLGAAGAARLHHRMLVRTLGWARDLAEATPLSLELRMDGPPGAPSGSATGPTRVREQGPGDLGDRMARAVEDSLTGADTAPQRVVIIGTDCPDLSAEIVTSAFAELERHDVVLGPAADGGYYLIALRAPARELFSGIDWGTDRVYEQTISRAREAGLSVASLEVLEDVDRPEDLAVWERTTGEAALADA